MYDVIAGIETKSGNELTSGIIDQGIDGTNSNMNVILLTDEVLFQEGRSR